MLNAQDVADFFLSPVEEEEGELISNLKLQKMLYYAQGYALAILGRPLFNDSIENWLHGPVVVSVYHTYKVYGNSPLPLSHIEPEKYQPDELFILNKVREEKGQFTAWKLRNMTHQETPWLNSHRGEEILKEDLKDFFCRVLPVSSFNFDLERMQERVEGQFVRIPHFDNPMDLMNWLEEN